jgi:hypothetical protein
MQGNLHGRCMTWKSLLPYHSFLRCAFQAAIGECVKARGHRAANPIAMPGWRVLYADRWPYEDWGVTGYEALDPSTSPGLPTGPPCLFRPKRICGHSISAVPLAPPLTEYP